MDTSLGLKLSGNLGDAAAYIAEHSDISREDADRLVKSIHAEGGCRMAEAAAIIIGIPLVFTAGLILLSKLIEK